MKRNLLALVALMMYLFFPTVVFTQNCVTIAPGSYTGSTTEGAFGKYGNTSSISITLLSDNTLKISDFTGGFMNEFQKDGISVELTFNCDGSIISKQFQTDWGTAIITGGSYDESQQKLSLNWKIPNNDLVEKSIFLKN